MYHFSFHHTNPKISLLKCLQYKAIKILVCLTVIKIIVVLYLNAATKSESCLAFSDMLIITQWRLASQSYFL